MQLVSSIIPSSILTQYTQGHSAGFTAKMNLDTKQDAHNAVVSNFFNLIKLCFNLINS